MATNLFALPQGASNAKALVEFRAGKMTFSNKKVTPDKRKGLVQLTQSPDSLIHFVWKDRTTGAVEDDLIIFPEEAIFKKITQSNGRVFLLEFKSSNKKHFFWMQEPKDDKDDENCTKINQYIDNPPNPEQAGTGGAPLNIPGLGAIDQNALFQMFGGRGQSSPSQPQRSGGVSSSSLSNTASPSSPSTSSASQNASQQGVNLGVNDLQSILSGMGMPTSTINNMLQQRNQQRQNQPSSQSSAALQSALINELLPLLPEERRSPEEIQQVLRSPQFQQSLETFSSALQSGQLTDMIRQFNIQSTGGPQTIESFLQSLQNQAQSSSSSTSTNQSSTEKQDEKKEDKDKKDDDKMDI